MDLAVLAALALAAGSEAGVCLPKITTALSITTSDGATTASTIAITSVSTETVSVTSSETSVVSSETSTSADTSESKTEMAWTTASNTTSTTADSTSTTESTTSTGEITTSTTEGTTSTTQGTIPTTDMASTTDEATSSTSEGTTTTTEAASTTSTQAPLQPTVTAKVTLKMPPGLFFTLSLKNQNDYLANYESTDTFIFIREGGAATLGPNGSKKLALVYPGADKRIISLLAEANAPFVPYEEFTCGVAEDDTISCEAPSVDFDNLYPCGS